jgi:hypothetical protein
MECHGKQSTSCFWAPARSAGHRFGSPGRKSHLPHTSRFLSLADAGTLSLLGPPASSLRLPAAITAGFANTTIAA